MVELNLNEFGIRIAELRELSGKSQEEISENLGITQQTLSRYEKGQRQASLDFVVKAAQYFNVSTDYLLGFSKVKSAEEDVKCICRITGLSEKAVIDLNCFKDVPKSKHKNFYKELYKMIKYSEGAIYDRKNLKQEYSDDFFDIKFFEQAFLLFGDYSSNSKENFRYIHAENQRKTEKINRLSMLLDEADKLVDALENMSIRERESNPLIYQELKNKATMIIEKIQKEREQDADNNSKKE